ncbi:MAG TPA: YceI family protein [Caulobacteraceae bacterium]
MSKPILAAAAALALILSAAAPATAQLPPGVFAGEHDYKQATAGPYALDPAHTAVIAKVSHIGYSMSVFRFDKTAGTLTWDPAQPAKSGLNVTVETASISTPVPGFAAELSGDAYLKTAAFPKATFVSTAFRQIDASHGQVDGQFTLLGKTAPLTFDVELMGAGKGFMGHPRLGIEATAKIKPQDFGMSPFFTTPIQLVIDAEFSKAS